MKMDVRCDCSVDVVVDDDDDENKIQDPKRTYIYILNFLHLGGSVGSTASIPDRIPKME